MQEQTKRIKAIREAINILSQAGIEAQWVRLFGAGGETSIITLPGVELELARESKRVGEGGPVADPR